MSNYHQGNGLYRSNGGKLLILDSMVTAQSRYASLFFLVESLVHLMHESTVFMWSVAIWIQFLSMCLTHGGSEVIIPSTQSMTSRGQQDVTVTCCLSVPFAADPDKFLPIPVVSPFRSL